MQKLNIKMENDKSKSKKQKITTEKQIVIKKEKALRTQRKEISKNSVYSVIGKSGV